MVRMMTGTEGTLMDLGTGVCDRGQSPQSLRGHASRQVLPRGTGVAGIHLIYSNSMSYFQFKIQEGFWLCRRAQSKWNQPFSLLPQQLLVSLSMTACPGLHGMHHSAFLVVRDK